MPEIKFPLNRPQYAVAKFTDREEYQKIFYDHLYKRNNDRCYVIYNYGVGGIGKSKIQKELIKQLEEKDTTELMWVRLNFRDPDINNPVSFARHLRHLLSNQPWGIKNKPWKIRFRFFDTAYAIYLAKTNPDATIKDDTFSFLQSSDHISSIASIFIESFGPANAIAKTGILVKDLIPHLFSGLSAEEKQDMKQFKAATVRQMEGYLFAFFALDIKKYLEKEDKQLVIFLDTFEAEWPGYDGKSQGAFFNKDACVQELILHLDSVLWHISGRERLKWDETDGGWAALMEQHLIKELDPKDIRSFLRSAEMDDEQIIEAIVTSSKGHPFYLDLTIETWHTIIMNGRKPKVGDFENRTHTSLFDLFFENLSELEQILLPLLAIPRFWDKTLFKSVKDKYCSGYSEALFIKKLIQSPYVNETDRPGYYTLHELMRENFANSHSPERLQEYEKFFFDYHDSEINPVNIGRQTPSGDETGVFVQVSQHHINHLEEAFYHAKNLLNPQDLFSWFGNTATVFKENAKWGVLLPLYQTFLDLQIQNPVGQTIVASCYLTIGHILKQTSDYEGAEDYLNKALDISEANNDNQTKVACLLRLSEMCFDTADYERAVTLSRMCLMLSRETYGDDDMSTDSVTNTLGLALHHLGQHKEAEQIFRQLLEKNQFKKDKSLTEKLNIANTMNNLAMCLDPLKEFEAAEHFFTQSLALKTELKKDDHPDFADSLNNLALVLLETENYEMAGKYAFQALEKYESVHGVDNYRTSNVLQTIGAVLYYQEQYEKSFVAFMKAWAINYKIFGHHHVQTVSAKQWIAKVLTSMNRLEDAMDVYDSIHAKLKEKHNSELKEMKPLLATCYLVLAQNYLSRKNYARSLECSERALRLDPQRPEIYLSRSVSHSNIGKYAQALVDINKAIDLNPEDKSHYYFGRVKILYALNRFKEAKADLARAVALNPEINGIFLMRGIFNYGLDNLEGARTDFSEHIQSDPDNSDGFEVRATYIYLDMENDYTSALSDINQAIELNPENGSHYFWRGIIYLVQQEYHLALEDFNQACKADPTRCRHFFWRGCAYQLLNLKDNGQKDFEHTLRINSKENQSSSDRVAFFMAEHFSGKEKIKEAIRRQGDEIKAVYKPDSLRAMLFDLKRLFSFFPNEKGTEDLIQIVKNQLAMVLKENN